MQTAIDISLYPLLEDYEPAIIAFIHHLRTFEGVKVHTNSLTTQLSGDYDAVMDAIKVAIRRTFDEGGTYSFVVKILNVAIEPGEVVEV